MQRFRATAGQNHMGAACRHAQCDATADASAAAGDEDDLIEQDVGGKNLHLESFSLALVPNAPRNSDGSPESGHRTG
jgi:hypothetical protein